MVGVGVWVLARPAALPAPCARGAASPSVAAFGDAPGLLFSLSNAVCYLYLPPTRRYPGVLLPAQRSRAKTHRAEGGRVGRVGHWRRSGAARLCNRQRVGSRSPGSAGIGVRKSPTPSLPFRSLPRGTASPLGALSGTRRGRGCPAGMPSPSPGRWHRGAGRWAAPGAAALQKRCPSGAAGPLMWHTVTFVKPGPAEIRCCF